MSKPYAPTPERLTDIMKILANAPEVKALGDRIGYGNLMQTAMYVWMAENMKEGLPLEGAHIKGPSAHFAVECGCKNPVKCDWCCACQWLTPKVKALKDQMEGA